MKKSRNYQISVLPDNVTSHESMRTMALQELQKVKKSSVTKRKGQSKNISEKQLSKKKKVNQKVQRK